MLLSNEIKPRNIILDANDKAWRSTSYDSIVGQILFEGVEVRGDCFVLPPRGICWVISKEAFNMPSDVTGLVTLKTSWTHDGLLALNHGIIDPGWSGPISTAIVNFSTAGFEIQKGESFFRVVFFSHRAALVEHFGQTRKEYCDTIKLRMRPFSKTFMAMDSLVEEVAQKVLALGFPRWALIGSLAAVVLAVASITIPTGWTAASQNYVMPSRVGLIESELTALRTEDLRRINSELAEVRRSDASTKNDLGSLDTRLRELETQLAAVRSTNQPIALPSLTPSTQHR